MGIRLGVYMCVWSHRSVCSGTLTSTITTHFSLSQPKRKTHWPRCRLQVNMGYVDSSYVLLFEIGPKMNLAPWRRQSTGTLKYLFPRLHNRLLTKTFYFIFWSCRMTVPTVSVPDNRYVPGTTLAPWQWRYKEIIQANRFLWHKMTTVHWHSQQKMDMSDQNG